MRITREGKIRQRLNQKKAVLATRKQANTLTKKKGHKTLTRERISKSKSKIKRKVM